MESEASGNDDLLNEVVSSVGVVADQVKTLNERVFTKNSLDNTRNKLFRITIIASLTLAGIIAALLVAVVVGNRAEANRANDRAREAISFRHQLADCQLPPGAILEDGFVNLGKCFSDNAGRVTDILETFKGDLFNQILLSNNCIYWRERNVRPNICSEVNARVDSVGKGINPFIVNGDG